MSLEGVIGRLRRSENSASTTLPGEVPMPAYNHMTTGSTSAERFGIPRNDTGVVDRTAALQAAVNESVGKLILPPGTIRLASGGIVLAQRHGLIIEGQGAFNSGEGTRILVDNANCKAFDFRSTYQCQLRNVMIDQAQIPTSGGAIELKSDTGRTDGPSMCVFENIFIRRSFNGVYATTCNNINIENISTRELFGDFGIYVGGISANQRSDVVNIDKMVGDIGFGSDNYKYVARQNNTAYSIGDLAHVGGRIYVCTVAGTTGGTAPTSKGVSVSDRTVTDGTVTWKYLGTTSLTWVCQDSFAYTVGVSSARLINGAYGMRMIDGAATGSSFPTWLRATDVDCDHCIIGGVTLSRGEDFMATDLWVSSTQGGNGVTVASTHRGGVRIINSEINFSAQNGILFDSGPSGNFVIGSQIGHNSRSSFGAHHGINFGSTAILATVANNRLDSRPTSTSNDQGWGVLINSATNNRYVITNNQGVGNQNGLISDTTNNATRIVTGNIT